MIIIQSIPNQERDLCASYTGNNSYLTFPKPKRPVRDAINALFGLQQTLAMHICGSGVQEGGWGDQGEQQFSPLSVFTKQRPRILYWPCYTCVCQDMKAESPVQTLPAAVSGRTAMRSKVS